MVEGKRPSLVKPTVRTPYHIDFSWWSANDREYRVHLRSLLTEEDLQAFGDIDSDELVDWVDPATAEVLQVDGLQHFLIARVAQRPDFLDPRTALVEAIFRLLLKNGNNPMPVTEIADQLNRPAEHILRTLSGGRVYRGIRPIQETP